MHGPSLVSINLDGRMDSLAMSYLDNQKSFV